jgi:hypothetical protein
MANGHGRIARWLLHDYDRGIDKSDLLALIPESTGKPTLEGVIRDLTAVGKRHIPHPFRVILKKGYQVFKAIRLTSTGSELPSRLEIYRQTRQEIEEIEFPSTRTDWSTYYDGFFPPFVPTEDWTPKHHNVYKVLSDLHPPSVLDIGSNRGWYSQLAAVLGSKVVALDVDEVCTAQLYLDAKKHGFSIMPLVMDFRNPSPGYGLCNQWLTPAIQRLNCDMVLALALVHHLVFKQHLNFGQIVQGLSVFARRWLLVEFVPREDQYVRDWWSEEYSWYTQENLVAVLSQEFHKVAVYSSYPAPRILLLCEK